MKKLSLKRWVFFFHLAFSGILLGTTTIFLIFSINAAATSDESVLRACYTAMSILATTSIRASTIGVVVTGILLSLLTKWGLFRFYWIIVKEVLTLVAIGLGIFGFYFWTLHAVSGLSSEGVNAISDPAFTNNRLQLFIGIILQILSLAAMFAISVFKPWGMRKQRDL